MLTVTRSCFPGWLVLAACLAGLWSGAAAADVPKTINHQGVVQVGITPFSGTGSFRFAIMENGGGLSLWTNDGSNIGTGLMPANAVSLEVNNGVYSVRLGDTALYGNMVALPPSALADDGNGLSLRIWFDDGAHGAQELLPVQPLTSAPFAYRAGDAEMLGGRPASHYSTYEDGYFTHLFIEEGQLEVTGPGNAISSLSTGADTAAVLGENYDGNEGVGVRGTAAGAEAIGVLGEATGENGTAVIGHGPNTGVGVLGTGGTGVFGQSLPSGGVAVKGYAYDSGAVTNYGGWFHAQALTGKGVYGETAGDRGIGVHGKSTTTGGSFNYGGYFEAVGPVGRGLYASAAGDYGVGVDIFTEGANGLGLHAYNDYNGLRAELAGPDSAGYFEGDVVTTEAYKYQSPKSYTRQIPAAAFQVNSLASSANQQLTWDYGCLYRSTGLGDAQLVAPVDLPQGATMTAFNMYYYDNDSDDDFLVGVYFFAREATATARLQLARNVVTTAGNSTSIQVVTDTTFAASDVDNEEYQYIIECTLGPMTGLGMRFYGASIEYTLETVAP